jgi:uncharacterized protein with TBP-like fold DUF4468
MNALIWPGLLFFTTAAAFGQQQAGNRAKISIPTAGNKVEYRATVHLDPALSKETLFDNAQQWYKNNFESADNTLTIDNKEKGKISGTGILHAGTHERETYPGDVFFTIDVTVADGEYEYIIHDLYGFDKTGKFDYSDMYNEEQYPETKPRWPASYRHTMLENMNNRITGLLPELYKEMLVKKEHK